MSELRRSIRDQILQIQHELNLSDWGMATNLCMSESEFERFRTGNVHLSIIQLICFISATNRALDLPDPYYDKSAANNK